VHPGVRRNLDPMPRHDGVAEAEGRGDIGALVDLLSDTNRITRLGAAQALGRLESREAVRPLLRCLQAADELVRLSALKALAKIGDSGVSDAVFEVATTDDSFGVRTTAAETLARLGDPRAFPLIVAPLLDGTAPHRRGYGKWATRLLVELDATEAIPDLERASLAVGPVTRRRINAAIRSLRTGD
jgi:HEAT repeat protein